MKQSALKCQQQIVLWTRKLNSTKPHLLELSLWPACSKTKKQEPTLANQREEAEHLGEEQEEGGRLADEKTLVRCYNLFLKLSLSCVCCCWLVICFQLWSVYAWWRPVLGWNCCKNNTLRVTLSKADRGPQNLEPIIWRPPSIRSSELTSLPEGWTTRMTSTETRIKIRTLATSIIFITLFILSFVIIQVVSVPTPRKRAGSVQQEGALCLWEEPCRERHGWGWSFLLFVSRSKQKGRKSTNLNWKKWNLNICYICDMSALHFGFLDICDKMCSLKIST